MDKLEDKNSRVVSLAGTGGEQIFVNFVFGYLSQ